MKRKLSIAGVLALFAFAPMLMGPSGGFPSRPRFQAITVAGDADLNTIDGFAVTDIARLSQPATFTGAYAALRVSGTVPAWRVTETDAATNNQVWEMGANGEVFYGSAIDSAITASTRWLEVNRTGTSIDSIDLNATAVRVNGSPVCTANGANCPPDQTQKIRSARFGDTALNGGCNGCSWSKLATGSYQVTWDSNLSDPTCTATPSGTDARTIYPVISLATPSNGNVRVGVYNGIGGSLVDIPSGVNIQVICISGT